ncbi:hypothetical protein [Spirochaeta dissipatitropha]
MTGIIIGTIFFITRLLGGAGLTEALYIGGSIIFTWNMLIIGGSLASMLWVSLQHGQQANRTEPGSALSLLMSLFGLAGIAYLKQGRAALWFSGCILVLAGSSAISWVSGGNIHPAGAAIAAAAIGGGQYLRNLHRRRAESLNAGSMNTEHTVTTDENTGMRHVGSKSIESDN